MRAAIVSAAGQAPPLAERPVPIPAPGESPVRVSAAAISHLVKARASGAHYTVDAQLPLGVGMDGAGLLDGGSRVYFATPRAPYGSMAEYAVVDVRLCVPVPDGPNDLTAVAIANPGMSSWAALTERARMKPGETVLINGATGTAGRLAVQIARLLGTGRIVSIGRNVCALEEVRSLGADVTIRLVEDMLENRGDLQHRFMEEFAQGVDVVPDYLWAASAKNLLIATASAGRDAIPMRSVQIGSISAADITLPGGIMRASAIELMGSGGGSIALPRLIAVIGEVLHAAASDGLKIAFTPVPFSAFDTTWHQDNSACRTVFAMEGA
ncbi:quinone oxidoreductase family protein [Inquilinus limosus]|uniref:Alcohol dehydrogenase n=1 Tax=Inquilinus limosus TaxID=171674 RepID=A0A211ZUW6_9PROT|nr:zinc-binding alcohol dehydrogenase family protein [Inquilinus limosus]OWJ69081.1 alcohol dehydrogenase [Inquilinus limosus]